MYKGLERYPIALRFEEEERRNLDEIRNIQVKTPLGFVPLSTFTKVEYRQSASVIKSEMATPVTFIYITPQLGMSVVTYKEEAMKVLENIKLLPATTSSGLVSLNILSLLWKRLFGSSQLFYW